MELWREHGLKIVAGFAVLLAIAVVGSVLQGAGGSSEAGGPRPRRPGGATQAQTPPPGSHSYEDADESGPAVKPVTTSSDSQRPTVRAAVMGFLAWYLPYSYGQPSSAPVQNVTAGERTELAANRPEVPPGVERRHPKVVALVLKPYAAGEWQAAVQVTDGAVTYTLPLIVGDLPAGWEVMAIQE
jgi:hypothetical protein